MPLPPRVRRSISVLGAATGLVGAFAAGAAVTGDDDLQGRVDPIAFSGDSITLAASCDDLLEWYVARGVRRVGPWGWDTYDYEEDDRGFDLFGRGEDSADSGAAAGPADAPQASEYAAGVPSTVRSENGDSGTNVQESGVDEPDVVKTDGRTLFRVEDDDLVTYDVTGAEVERIGSADLEDLDDGEVLLSGDRLVVIGTDGGGSGTYYPEARQTRVIVLDVSDPTDPEVEHTYLYIVRHGRGAPARRHRPARDPGRHAGPRLREPTATPTTRNGRTARSSATPRSTTGCRRSPRTAATPSRSWTARTSPSPTTGTAWAPSSWPASTRTHPTSDPSPDWPWPPSSPTCRATSSTSRPAGAATRS